MSQILTPPHVINDEDAHQNWQRSENLKRITVDLLAASKDIPLGKHLVKQLLSEAIERLGMARAELSPPPKPAPPPRLGKF